MFKPKSLNIFGKEYDIVYCDNPSDVDFNKRTSLWGQLDSWTRTIRIFDNNRKDGDITETIMHEIIHAIVMELNIKTIQNADDFEEIVELLGIGIADTLTRNNLLKIE